MAGAQAQWRKAFVAEIVNRAAKLPERIDQIANRPLVHARNARQLKLPAQQCERRRQGAHGRAGIAHEK